MVRTNGVLMSYLDRFLRASLKVSPWFCLSLAALSVSNSSSTSLEHLHTKRKGFNYFWNLFHLLTSTTEGISFLPFLLYDWGSKLEIQESEKIKQIGPSKEWGAQQPHISSKIHIQGSSIGVCQHQPSKLGVLGTLLSSVKNYNNARKNYLKCSWYVPYLYWATSSELLAVPMVCPKPQRILPTIRRGKLGDTAIKTQPGIPKRQHIWTAFLGPYFPPRYPPTMAPKNCPINRILAA